MTLPDGVRREPGQGGIERIVVDRPSAYGEVYLQGATVTAWVPRGHDPVLFLSREANFRRGAAIRGGVPICFPWFGPKAGDPKSAQHGFARTAIWTLDGIEDHGDAIGVALSLADDAATRASFPHPFRARLAVRFGEKLELGLLVENLDQRPMKFEAALHAYFAVRDVRAVQIRGLERANYIDKVQAGARGRGGDESLEIEGETDRVYVGLSGGVELVDAESQRRISIQTDGTRSLVVWNPWIDQARALKDLADDEWTRMVCLEPANAADDEVVLAPAQSHEMRMRVVVNA